MFFGAFKNIFLWKFSPDLRPLWPEPKPLIKYVDSCNERFYLEGNFNINLLILDESSVAYDNSMYFHWVPAAYHKKEEQTYPMYVYFDSINRIKIENVKDIYNLGAIIK